MELKVIGTIHTDFEEKFGIPRQSGLVEELQGTIVMEKDYRNPDAFRGLEEYSHIWLLWQFSRAEARPAAVTVRPPRLGGNQRRGVFATRSPYRPNGIGLSCVRLVSIEQDRRLGPVLHVAGADLLDGTPIYDIKPYLPYTDARPDASGGFAEQFQGYSLRVECRPELLEKVVADKQKALLGVLAQDPRPAYQEDPNREYGLSFAGYQIRFRVEGDCLFVLSLSSERV